MWNQEIVVVREMFLFAIFWFITQICASYQVQWTLLSLSCEAVLCSRILFHKMADIL